MPIQFVCPHCGAALEFDDRYSGQEGPCTHCGKSIVVPVRRSKRSIPRSVVVLAAIAVVAAVGLAAAALVCHFYGCSDRETLGRLMCADRLKQIGLAMQQYEMANGCFPPAYIADKRGVPMHSWRVLLLPYLDQQELHDRYRFSEPWNGPGNRSVTEQAMGLFQCPSQPATKSPVTNYMMVVGPRTISNGPDSRSLAQITDGPASTIMIVEVADSNVPWAEPKDIRFEQMDFTINAHKGEEVSSYHKAGANVLFCDGSVLLLKTSTNPFLLKAMLTIDGGEALPAE